MKKLSYFLNMYDYYYKTPVLIGLIMFLLIFVILQICIRPSIFGTELAIEKWTVVEDKDKLFDSNEVHSVFYFQLEKPTYVVLEKNISLIKVLLQKTASVFDFGKYTEKEYVYIYFPDIDLSYMEIYADGILQGRFGEPNKRLSYSWFQPLVFAVPKNSQKIRLILYGNESMGINAKPFFTYSLSKYSIVNAFSIFLIPFFLGLMMVTEIFFLYIFFKLDKSRKKHFLFFALSILFFSIWTLDLLPHLYFDSQTLYYLTRRVFITSMFISPIFLILGLTDKMMNSSHPIFNKWMRIVTIFFSAFTLILSIFTPNRLFFSEIEYPYIYFLQIIVYGLIVIASFLTYSRTLIFSSIVLAFSLVNDTLWNLNLMESKTLIPIGAIIYFGTISGTLIEEYKNVFTSERVHFAKSVTDSLTGAYNRHFLDHLKLQSNDTVVLIDLNNLKKINDTHGHEVGDEIIKKLVEVLRSNIRSTDYIVRLGGDEFLVILPNCPLERAENLIKNSLREYRQSHWTHPTFAYGFKKFEVDFKKTLEEVDKLMYQKKEEMKKESKN